MLLMLLFLRYGHLWLRTMVLPLMHLHSRRIILYLRLLTFVLLNPTFQVRAIQYFAIRHFATARMHLQKTQNPVARIAPAAGSDAAIRTMPQQFGDFPAFGALAVLPITCRIVYKRLQEHVKRPLLRLAVGICGDLDLMAFQLMLVHHAAFALMAQIEIGADGTMPPETRQDVTLTLIARV
jgi:hypothetical protein